MEFAESSVKECGYTIIRETTEALGCPPEHVP